MIKVTDKTFRYTPSFDTNLKKKFAQIARQQRAATRCQGTEAGADHSVVPMVARRTAGKS